MQQLYDVFLSRLQEAEICKDLDSDGVFFAIVELLHWWNRVSQ